MDTTPTQLQGRLNILSAAAGWVGTDAALARPSLRKSFLATTVPAIQCIRAVSLLFLPAPPGRQRLVCGRCFPVMDWITGPNFHGILPIHQWTTAPSPGTLPKKKKRWQLPPETIYGSSHLLFGQGARLILGPTDWSTVEAPGDGTLLGPLPASANARWARACLMLSPHPAWLGPLVYGLSACLGRVCENVPSWRPPPHRP